MKLSESQNNSAPAGFRLSILIVVIGLDSPINGIFSFHQTFLLDSQLYNSIFKFKNLENLIMFKEINIQIYSK